MNRRAAVTLTEVLMAIFIMALGLISILALFPIAAVQMRQALQDQRAAEAATNAAAWFRIAWKDACEAGSQGQPTPYQRFVTALSRPSEPDTLNPYPLGAPFALLGLPPLNAPGPSYPVYVDPIGWEANALSPGMRWWVAALETNNFLNGGAPGGPGLPRRPLYMRRQHLDTGSGTVYSVFENPHIATPLFPSPSQRILRQFSLLDDMSFAPDGTAQTTGGQVERHGRYTWAYMVRRPNNLVAHQVELTVVVYLNRSIDVPSPERAYFGPVNSPTSVTLNYTTRPKPALRRGAWLLDATMTPSIPQGYFYRIVDVNDDTPNLLRLELQTPLRPIPGNPARRFLILDNVVEVFEKGIIDPQETIRPY